MHGGPLLHIQVVVPSGVPDASVAKDGVTLITVQLVRVSPGRKRKKAAETTEGGRGSVKRDGVKKTE